MCVGLLLGKLNNVFSHAALLMNWGSAFLHPMASCRPCLDPTIENRIDRLSRLILFFYCCYTRTVYNLLYTVWCVGGRILINRGSLLQFLEVTFCLLSHTDNNLQQGGLNIIKGVNVNWNPSLVDTATCSDSCWSISSVGIVAILDS